MRTIADQWKSYEAEVLPPNAPAVQRQECRRAFYAGAAAMLGVFTEVAGADVSEDAGVQILEGLHQEARAFATAMLRGQA